MGYRLGQGLGTAARFIDSPLGRGLIAGGLMSAFGGSPALSLGTGLTAGVGRQNAVTADKLYRNQLKQMGVSDEELANIRGNITSDVFKNIVSGLRFGNQRMTYGQLAMFDDSVKEFLQENPEMYNQYFMISMSNFIN